MEAILFVIYTLGAIALATTAVLKVRRANPAWMPDALMSLGFVACAASSALELFAYPGVTLAQIIGVVAVVTGATWHGRVRRAQADV